MGLFARLLDHLKGHPTEYMLMLVVAVGAGWQGNAVAQRWMNDKVKDIVQAQAAPIQAQLGEVKSRLDKVDKTLQSIEAANLAAELREKRTLLCYSPGDDRLIREYDAARSKYEALTGARYEPLPCEILKKR